LRQSSEGSYNRLTLNALAELAPDDFEITVYDLAVSA
jgi:hypothetical protein